MIQYAAIWYDGYLVPGENFDDAIQDAIDMSEDSEAMFLYIKQATALYGALANQTHSEGYRIRYGSGLLKLGIYAEQADMIEQAREIFVELKKNNPLNQDMDRWIKACDEAIKRWC